MNLTTDLVLVCTCGDLSHYHKLEEPMTTILTWYGHAALGLETGGKKILVNPYFSGNPSAATTADKVLTDFILLTHGHGDHLGNTVAIAKRTGATVISNMEISRWLGKQGVTAQGQQFGESCQYSFGSLQLTPALPGTGLPDGSDGGKPGGFFLITPDSEKIYIAGDTTLFDEMKLIRAEGLDLAPKHVIPYHYSTWDRIVQGPRAWAARVAKETATQVYVLKPGDSFEL
jgi:L-ascorbate metabolism protein UlaG (beta-lactamase superfamily)